MVPMRSSISPPTTVRLADLLLGVLAQADRRVDFISLLEDFPVATVAPRRGRRQGGHSLDIDMVVDSQDFPERAMREGARYTTSSEARRAPTSFCRRPKWLACANSTARESPVARAASTGTTRRPASAESQQTTSRKSAASYVHDSESASPRTGRRHFKGVVRRTLSSRPLR